MDLWPYRHRYIYIPLCSLHIDIYLLGKTWRAIEILGEGYYDKLLNKWWEDYKGEPNVLIDDIGPECIKADHVKRWLDKRKFKAEIKYGSVNIRPEIIVITSNYHPSEIWPKPSDHDPILDRVEVIHLSELKKWDDTTNKRKASKDAATERPKLARQDAIADFAGTAEQRARFINVVDEDNDVVEVRQVIDIDISNIDPDLEELGDMDDMF